MEEERVVATGDKDVLLGYYIHHLLEVVDPLPQVVYVAVGRCGEQRM